MEPRLLRGAILFLFKDAAAAAFCEGDCGSSSAVATDSASSLESLAGDVCIGSPDIDRRDLRAGRAVLGVGASEDVCRREALLFIETRFAVVRFGTGV